MKKGILVLLILQYFWGAASTSAQCIAGDCQNGYGALQTENGKYEGHFVNGAKDGEGKYTWNSGESYNGNWVNNAMNGTGTIIFADGKKFVGTVVNGVANEDGTYYMQDGTIDHTRGYGKSPEQKTEIKKGCATGDCKTGFGIFYYDNGEHYEGNFKEGYRSGKGKFYWNTGEIYDGDWYMGKMEGYGTSTYQNGTKYTGEYKDGKITGNGTYYYADGTIDKTRGTGSTDKTKTQQTQYDGFATTIQFQIDDVDIDFATQMGDEKEDYTCKDITTKAFECLYGFSDALDCRIEETTEYTYKEITEFYNGTSKKEALAKYEELLEKIKTGLPAYTFKEGTVGGDAIKSMLGGEAFSTVQQIPAFNLRLDKTDTKYIVSIEVGYMEM